MDNGLVPVILVALISGGALAGFFWTKGPGYGKYTTALLLLIVVTSLTALLAAAGRLEPQGGMQLLIAVAGFAGGLIAGGRSEEK